MDFIDSENAWVPKGTQIVVLLSSVPYHEVIEDKTDLPHKLGNINVVRIETVLFSYIHNNDAAITFRLH